MLLCKSESSLEKKNSFTEGFFFQASQNPLGKTKVYQANVVIQNSPTKCYYEFCLRLHKDLEMLILVASFLLLKKGVLCKIKNTIPMWKIIQE